MDGTTNFVLALVLVAAMSVAIAGRGLVTGFVAFVVFAIGSAMADKFVRRAVLLIALWTAWQVAADMILGTQVYSRQAAVGPAAAAGLMVFWWLYKAQRFSRASVVCVVATGWLALVLLNKTTISERYVDNAWKFGVGPPIALLALGLAWKLGWNRVIVAAIAAGLAYLSFQNDSRFYLVVSGATAVAVLLHRSSRMERRSSVVIQVGIAAAAVGLAVAAYQPLADAGYLGARAQSQEAMIAGDKNILIANRPELPQAFWIWAHHPVLGIGSAAPLDGEDAAGALDFVNRYGADLDKNGRLYLLGNRDPDAVVRVGYASHSGALDTMVHAGIGAGPFWIFYLFAVCRMIVFRARETAAGAAVVVWLGSLCVWDALFSPLVGFHWIEISLALFLAASQARPERKPTSSPEPEWSDVAPGRPAWLGSSR